MISPGWWDLIQNGATPVIDAEDRDFVTQALSMLPAGPYDSGTWGAWTSGGQRGHWAQGQSSVYAAAKSLDGPVSWPGYGRSFAAVAKNFAAVGLSNRS
jgi:glutamyl-tRNA synthetase